MVYSRWGPLRKLGFKRPPSVDKECSFFIKNSIPLLHCRQHGHFLNGVEALPTQIGMSSLTASSDRAVTHERNALRREKTPILFRRRLLDKKVHVPSEVGISLMPNHAAQNLEGSFNLGSDTLLEIILNVFYKVDFSKFVWVHFSLHMRRRCDRFEESDFKLLSLWFHKRDKNRWQRPITSLFTILVDTYATEKCAQVNKRGIKANIHANRSELLDLTWMKWIGWFNFSRKSPRKSRKEVSKLVKCRLLLFEPHDI